MEAGSLDIPNLETLRAKLGDDFAIELLDVFAQSSTIEEVREKLASALDACLKAQQAEQEGSENADDPVA